MTQPNQNSRFQPTQISPDDLNPEHMLPGWDGKTDRRLEKRANDDEPLTKGEFERRIAGFRHYTAAVNTRFALFEEKLLSRIEELDKTLKSGFPEGDPDNHRRDHETRIRLENEKAKLYKSVREKVIASGVWGMFVLLAMAIWEYIKANVAK